MQESDIQELQKDTFTIILFVMTALALTLAYIMLVVSQILDYYYYIWWLPSTLALATCALSFRLYRRDSFRLGTYVFIGGLTIAITTFAFWPNSTFQQREIYLLMLIVAMAGLLINPRAAIWAANFAVVCVITASLLVQDWEWANFTPLVAPLAMTYAIAAVSWISSSHLITTLRWAYDSQARAQQRSLELFESQQELKRAYQLQETTNIRLQQAEAEARQVSEFKTRFITNLSHELRTPLSAIISFSYVLSRNRYGKVTEEQREYLNRIHDAGELLLEVTNDLLDLAKIEAGQMDLFIDAVDLYAVSSSVLNTTSGVLTDKPVFLKQDIQPDLPPIYADETRIRQILINLLGNAAKYTDEGSITLRIFREDDDFVRLSIIDTGIGIRAEDFERIFEEFQQTKDAFALRKVGTGLGLPISKKFAQLHGGDLWLESEFGTGTTFHLLLPINAPEEELDIQAEQLSTAQVVNS